MDHPGLAHLASLVPSVDDARREALSAGGAPVGEIVTLTTSSGASVTWCHVTDPEGNIVEFQTRS